MLLGVDVGGTFTDAVLLAGERIVTGKAPTTPRDQSSGVLDAVESVLERAGARAGDVERFVHGMTVGTNALLEGKVARTALLATRGFTDMEELGRQARAALYRLCAGHPPPLVPDELRVAVHERTSREGVLEPLDEPRLESDMAAVFGPERVEAAAVCLLWGFRHPEHEERVERLVGSRHPAVHVSTSHETAGLFREYERCATTVVDAALSPLLRRYLERLADRAEQAGLPLPEVMLSGGGVGDAATAARHASWTVLSGPAGGAVGAARVARRADAPDAVCLDMGGTSCDVSVASSGSARQTGGRQVGGRALALPMVDVHTVGAGGGSIAWADPGGALRVGPHSAGADPGPACYGRGGEQPTVTDANLLLGYLDHGAPLAGGLTLDRAAAERAVGGLGERVGLSPEETAEGIVRVAGVEMARAVRVMTVERGVDPRPLALVAFGGAGPLHAAAIAEEIGMGRVIVPRSSGVLSALGLVVSERRRDLVESVLLTGDALTRGDVSRVVERLAARGRSELSAPRAAVHCGYDLRYTGQSFELTVAEAADPAPDALRRKFDAAHEERYGYADEDADLELVTVRVTVAVSGPRVTSLMTDGASGPERAGRRAIFHGQHVEASILRGGGHPSFEGPAIVELAEATLVVPPGWRAAEHAADGTMVLERS